MPGDNSQENNNSSTKSEANAQGDSSKNNGGTENKQESEKTIPYGRFAEVNNVNKDLKARLAEYEAKDKTEAEKKLLEEKNYQELIGNKDKTIKDLESKYNQEVVNNKTERLKFKISGALAKANVIDAEDGLKFVKYDDLLDSDNAEDEIGKRVGELVKNKAYLFKGTQRSTSENNVHGSQQKDSENGSKKSTHDNIIDSLARKLSKS